MMAVAVLRQQQVLSSKTVRPAILSGTQCMRHAEIMWSAVCLMTPHLPFNEGVRPHLYMDERKRSMPERRRLSLAQDVLGKPITSGLLLALAMKTWNMNVFWSTPRFIYNPFTEPRDCLVQIFHLTHSGQLTKMGV